MCACYGALAKFALYFLAILPGHDIVCHHYFLSIHPFINQLSLIHFLAEFEKGKNKLRKLLSARADVFLFYVKVNLSHNKSRRMLRYFFTRTSLLDFFFLGGGGGAVSRSVESFMLSVFAY